MKKTALWISLLLPLIACSNTAPVKTTPYAGPDTQGVELNRLVSELADRLF